MKIERFVDRAATLGFAMLLVSICVSVFSAQTSSTKRKKSKGSTVVKQTPPPISEPVIISRAEDYPVDNALVPPIVSDAVRKADNEERGNSDRIIADLYERMRMLEADKTKKDDYDQKQKRLALNLEILTKAEQRSESLRKQTFDMIERETTIRARLEQIENDLRSEAIDRSIAFVGSLRPDELRIARKKSLETERTNQQSLLVEVQRTRAALEVNVQKADQLVERLRVKLEAEIDAALSDNPTKP